jgi:hypothetical protein
MYQIFNTTNGNVFIVTNDGKTFIPANEANTDYQKYLKWVAEGNEAEEWTEQ